MDFDRSTQAKSWLFDEKSLAACREKATVFDVCESPKKKVRKFASGFHLSSFPEKESCTNIAQIPSSALNSVDQETLIQFHTHQMQTLVGPTAILEELRTSVTVLSTAITFFRRFYLSNSILSVNPRKMAAACCLFAAKVEEEKIQASFLSHATAVIYLKVKNAPLCANELRGVSVTDIEEYERLLMEGLNYQFRCHHPFSAMNALALDFTNFIAERKGDKMTRGVLCDDGVNNLLERASGIVQRSMVFSDAQFLFAPGHIAFAVIAIALGSVNYKDGCISLELKEYLIDRFARKSIEELDRFIDTVESVIHALYSCDMMDLAPMDSTMSKCVAKRANNMKRVLSAISSLRSRLTPRVFGDHRWNRKRSRDACEITPPRKRHYRGCAKVTPISLH